MPTIRVYADMVADLFHLGHVRFLEQARDLGDILVIGVHSDETVAGYKRRPITTMAERIAVVSACRFVDEVIPDAPLTVDTAWLDRHRLDLVVHGDDLDDESLELMYGVPLELGILRQVPYTTGISTSDLIERITGRVAEGTPLMPVTARRIRRLASRHRPCTRETAQCNLAVIRGIGVRPDCCTDHLRELMDFVHTLLDRHGIRHWLDWGSLLGAVRDQAFIPWDSDVDLGILADDLAAVLALRPDIERAGHALAAGDSSVKIYYSELNHASVDLYVWKRRDGMLTYREHPAWIWPGMHARIDFPLSYLDRPQRVSLYGREFAAPSPVDRFLAEHRYGPDYLTPARPVTSCGLGLPIEPDELTPTAVELLPRVRDRTEALVGLVEASFVGRIARRFIPGRGRWLLVAALPLEPAERHLQAARARAVAKAGDDAVVDELVRRLAWAESAIEEFDRPPRLLEVRRMYRRLRWVRSGLRKRRHASSGARAGYYQ